MAGTKERAVPVFALRHAGTTHDGVQCSTPCRARESNERVAGWQVVTRRHDGSSENVE